ncbi:DUF3298 and DUF4163 domain-containing protein [Algoriphagus sp. AGSA1]|uniref:DUF3298 and DUF4163 domain-containing protein n=1 Tax=Algoriphagus sp. AGSA1 TaxID=2907213 RepID=UPI001F3B2568|nr:DUF3298 and DUF4163 domain-containing protein [Algoriphagus sp. AGSA1]MCE7054355.1 DUF3298 and DUF4163 domain-containing protein [Algoriphagus sp. AGSA1]
MKHLLLIAMLLFFSCEEKEETEEQLTFTTKTFSSERCVDESCAKVEINWPVAENSDAAAPLNEAIMEQLLVYFHQDKDFVNLDSAAKDYLDSFVEFKTEFPDAPGEWMVELDAKLTYESDSTLSFIFTEFNYSGGAHPNSSVYYLNFDKLTGKSLPVDRVVLDQKKMLDLAEKAFREYHEVEEGLELNEDGRFFLPDTGFFLPNAIGYEGDTLHLTYIPYEIGPYAMGYTELEFPIREVKGLVRQ